MFIPPIIRPISLSMNLAIRNHKALLLSNHSNTCILFHVYFVVGHSDPVMLWDHLYKTKLLNADALTFPTLYGVEYCLDQCLYNQSISDMCESFSFNGASCFIHNTNLDGAGYANIQSVAGYNWFGKVRCTGALK